MRSLGVVLGIIGVVGAFFMVVMLAVIFVQDGYGFACGKSGCAEANTREEPLKANVLFFLYALKFSCMGMHFGQITLKNLKTDPFYPTYRSSSSHPGYCAFCHYDNVHIDVNLSELFSLGSCVWEGSLPETFETYEPSKNIERRGMAAPFYQGPAP